MLKLPCTGVATFGCVVMGLVVGVSSVLVMSITASFSTPVSDCDIGLNSALAAYRALAERMMARAQSSLVVHAILLHVLVHVCVLCTQERLTAYAGMLDWEPMDLDEEEEKEKTYEDLNKE